jgi:two-component system, NarL family, sensor histidine kinase DesK
MDTYAEPAAPPDARSAASHLAWIRGRRRLIFPVVLLAYLLYVGLAVAKYSHGTGAIYGYAILAAFSLTWLIAIVPSSLTPSFVLVGQAARAPWRRFWILWGVLATLFVAELPFARDAAFVMCVFITILTVARLGTRSLPIVIGLTLASLFVPAIIPAWHETVAHAFGDVTPLAIPVVALSVFASVRALQSNFALVEARAQLASLAAENERFRIARDLHDLLGHSLTTITVKAGLACRLGEADHARAVQEMAEVEALARRTMADVRAAVANYRDVTLAGELATGRELLRAAGVAAEIPRAVDVVDAAHQELFGWVVREGLTNVVRHAHASSCAVRLASSSVEIVDDGVGSAPATTPGSGLCGLRERVAAAGGVVEAGPLQPRGWRLRVSLAPAGSA